jgi:hypothetical protein
LGAAGTEGEERAVGDEDGVTTGGEGGVVDYVVRAYGRVGSVPEGDWWEGCNRGWWRCRDGDCRGADVYDCGACWAR